MIIDFHTHIFPDKIAARTISTLAEKANISPYSDGAVSGLLSEMFRGGIDLSVALPVLTSPKQFDSVLSFAETVNSTIGNGKIISFAGMHPDIPDKEEKIRLIKEKGFKGIKLHPDYQGVFFNDDRYIEILRLAKEYDLIVITHAGVDYGFPNETVKCTPDTVLDVLEKVGDLKLCLAHFGGHLMIDEVCEKLVGKNVYFDTSYVLKGIDKESFLRVLNLHGADKILFATDSPWSGTKEDVEKIKSFNLGKETEDKIFYKNAVKLLGL